MTCNRSIILFLLFYSAVGVALAGRDKIGFYRSKGLYKQGAAHCLALMNKTKDQDERKKLLLELAACYQFNTRDHTYAQAVKIYRQFISEYPKEPLCAKAYFNIGRCYDAFSTERNHDIRQAREAYRNSYERYSGSQWADQAYFWHANSFIYKLNQETAIKAVKMLEEFLKRYPKSFLKGVVHSQLSELNCAWLNNFKAAVTHSEAALACGIQDINLKRLHIYRLGYLYQFKLKDNKKAIKWYQRLLADSPTKSDPNYFVAEKCLKELMLKRGNAKQ